MTGYAALFVRRGMLIKKDNRARSIAVSYKSCFTHIFAVGKNMEG